jgi:hypothetical protein
MMDIGVSHNNLTLESILVSGQKGEPPKVSLVDFKTSETEYRNATSSKSKP